MRGLRNGERYTFSISTYTGGAAAAAAAAAAVSAVAAAAAGAGDFALPPGRSAPSSPAPSPGFSPGRGASSILESDSRSAPAVRAIGTKEAAWECIRKTIDLCQRNSIALRGLADDDASEALWFALVDVCISTKQRVKTLVSGHRGVAVASAYSSSNGSRSSRRDRYVSILDRWHFVRILLTI